MKDQPDNLLRAIEQQTFSTSEAAEILGWDVNMLRTRLKANWLPAWNPDREPGKWRRLTVVDLFWFAITDALKAGGVPLAQAARAVSMGRPEIFDGHVFLYCAVSPDGSVEAEPCGIADIQHYAIDFVRGPETDNEHAIFTVVDLNKIRRWLMRRIQAFQARETNDEA